MIGDVLHAAAGSELAGEVLAEVPTNSGSCMSGLNNGDPWQVDADEKESLASAMMAGKKKEGNGVRWLEQ